MIKAKLLKPLDGDAEGTIREFDKPDFDALSAMGAVIAVGDDDGLRSDGPTVAEYVARGYRASNYPPEGYGSRSTPEEVAAAISAQGDLAEEKAAQPVENKMAPAVENKADAGVSDVAIATSTRRARERNS